MDEEMKDSLSPEQEYQQTGGQALMAAAQRAAAKHVQRSIEIGSHLSKGLHSGEPHAAFDALDKMGILIDCAKKLIARGQEDAERLHGPTPVVPPAVNY